MWYRKPRAKGRIEACALHVNQDVDRKGVQIQRKQWHLESEFMWKLQMVERFVRAEYEVEQNDLECNACGTGQKGMCIKAWRGNTRGIDMCVE